MRQYCIVWYWRGIVNLVLGPYNNLEEAYKKAALCRADYSDSTFEVRKLC